ncbi:MAG: hypothetical protein HY828_07320 [Actinobacteria bacterium]|nr:hypothetical protein [Actinomycetota bacterium]
MLPTATVASKLISATVTSVYQSGTTSQRPIALRHATAYNWCGFNVNGDCNQPYSPYVGGLQYMTTGTVVFDVTSELQASWYVGAPNIAWAFSSGEPPSTYTFKELGSYITITWDKLPIVTESGVSPAANPYLFHQHLDGVDLSVPAQTDPDGEVLYYHFILCSQPTWTGCATVPGSVWLDSGWTTSNSFSDWVGLGFHASWYNQQLYWGVEVSNQTSTGFQLPSAWMRPWKLYNYAAAAPQLVSPVDGVRWSPANPPALTFTTPSDPDGDSVRYRVIVSEAGSQGAVWMSDWTAFYPPGTGSAAIQLRPDLPLTPESSYSWTVEFQDMVTYFHWYYWHGQPQGSQPATRATGFDDRLGSGGPSPTQAVGPVAVNMATGNLATSVALPAVPILGGSMGGSLSYNSRINDVGLRSWIVNDANSNGVQDVGEQASGSVDTSLKFKWVSPAALPGVSNLLATWSGYVTVPTTGLYYFGAALGADEKVNVTVAGLTALQVNWTAGASTIGFDEPLGQAPSHYFDTSFYPNVNAGSAGVALTVGVRTPISITYRNPSGSGQFALYTSTGDGFGDVPASWLSPSDRVLPRGWQFNHADGQGASYVAVRQDADQVFLVAPDGSRVAYQRSADGKAFVPPLGEDDVIALAADGTFVVTDTAGYVHSFDAKGELVSVTAPIDARSSAAPVSTWSAWNPPGTTTTSSRLTAQTDPTTGLQVTYTYQGVSGSTCPTTGAYVVPLPGMLCKVTYPDGSDTTLYYVADSLGEPLLARVQNPGDVAVGRGSVDLGYSHVSMGAYTLPLISKIRGELANDALAAGLITTADDFMTLVSYETAGTGKVTAVTLPKASASDTARQGVTFEYVAGTNETRTHVDGLDNTSSSTDWDRKATFDATARVLLDYRALNDASTIWSQSDTRWDATGDRVDATIVDKQATTYLYNRANQLVDQYGPANESCFNLTIGSGSYRLPNGTCTTPGVPHTTTEYDTLLNANGTSTAITGLAATVWPNPNWSGPPSNVATGVGPNYTTLSNSWSAAGPAEATNAAGAALVDNFSMRLQGEIVFPAAGAWTVTPASDDVASVFIDDKLIASSTAAGSTPGAYTVSGDLTKRIRIDFNEVTGSAALTVSWAGPGVSQQPIPSSALHPRYGLATRTTTVDSGGATPDMVTHTEYSATGIDPALGLPTRVTVDPTGQRLTTTTGYETSGYRRRISRTLPSGTTTGYDYYGAGAGAAVDVACTTQNDTTVNQGGRLRTTISASAADGKSIITETVYDRLGRIVASRRGTRLAGVDTWEGWGCTTFDARWRPTTTTVPAFGIQPSRTITYNYAVSGNPLVTSIADPTVLRTVSDLLGRTVESDDYWGLASTAAFHQTTGRLVSTNGPAGAQTFTYDRGGRLTQQTLDGNVVAVPAYTNAADPNPHTMATVSYPSGTGNGGNGTTGTITRSAQTGALTGLSWKKGTTLITSDTVDRSITGRVTNDYIDGAGSPSWAYRYDTAGRLARASGSSHDYEYRYANTSCTGTGNNTAAGANSNRTLVRDNGVTTQASCYDTADRLTKYGTPSASYTTRLNTPSAPAVWWKLGDTSGTTAVATNGGTAANGTYTAAGVTKNQAGAPTGVTNPSVLFAGGNVQVPVSTVTGSGKSFTLWFKSTSSGVLLSKNLNAAGGAVGSTSSPMLYVGTDGKLRGQVFGGPVNPVTTPQVVTDGRWHHVVLAVAANAQTLYVDGVKIGANAAATVDDSWGPAFAYIGTGATSGSWPATTGGWMPFQGSIDEVAVYNTVLTDANVAAQDNPVPTAGLVSPTYDAHGNTVTLNGDSYTYDGSDRHTKTVHGSTTVTYVRDAADNIVARTDSTTGTTVRYSGNVVLDTANTVIERTITLPGGAMVTKRAAGDVWSYPNIHGDITATCNATGTKQGATILNDPYGSALGALADNSNGTIDYGWVGQHTKLTEHASGLLPTIEMGARPYNPTLGRFLEVDPVEGGTTTNDYGYVPDPVNMYDLNGTCGVFGNPFKECDDSHQGEEGFLGGAFTKAGRAIAKAAPSVSACMVVCMELGYSRGSGFYATPGIGIAVSTPSLAFGAKPHCGLHEIRAFGEVAFGPFGLGRTSTRPYKSSQPWRTTDFRSYSLNPRSWVSTLRGKAGFSAGAGVVIQKTFCSR